jgi:hypothetical protein
VLISLALQLVVVGIGVSVFWTARYLHNSWIAGMLLLGLAGISLSIYGVVLSRVNHLAQERRETLVAELCRA